MTDWEHERYDDNDKCNHRFGWEDGHHVCHLEVSHIERKEMHECVCGATDFLPLEAHYD